MPPEAPPETELHNRIHQLEQQLADTQARLDAAQHELDDLAHFISHDLRAPLRGVDGYSQALLQDYDACLDEVGKAYLNFIRDASRGASLLIDRLLVYLRAMRGPLQAQTVDLSALAGEIVAGWQESQPERSAVITIAPHLTAQADPRLAEVLLNELLGNAWKYTTYRPVAQITFCQQIQNGQAVFCVQDNGAGFKMEYVTRLFRPFERLHAVHEFEGQGLGLAIARRIIERHAGRIWASANVDQGASFFFTLTGSPNGANPPHEP